jgi:hypothetical protein
VLRWILRRFVVVGLAIRFAFCYLIRVLFNISCIYSLLQFETTKLIRIKVSSSYRVTQQSKTHDSCIP